MHDDNHTRNSFSGHADALVQAGRVHGGVHVHGSAQPVLPTARQLPFDTSDFTGRVDELRQLDDALAVRRAVVITGAPGVGKTATAVRWAHRESDRFPDGQLYVNLRGFDETPPLAAHQALDAFVRALGVAPERIPAHLDELAALYRSLLANRRILVVLDNAADDDQVRPLLPGSPTCAVVITSRSTLAGSIVDTGARRITLEPLSTIDAVALLEAAVGADRLDSEPEAALELAQLCACLPLALRIAGERVTRSPHRTISDLVEQFGAEQQRLDLLATTADGAGAVRAAFSWSYAKLRPAAAGMFRRLGLHPGPEFGVPAAAALAGVPEARARRTLEALVEANLLTEIGPERYRFHDLVWLYAVESARTESVADQAAAVRRSLQWYLRMADAADHLLTCRSYCVPLGHTRTRPPAAPFADRLQALRWCDRERVNLMAAIRQASDRGEHAIAWRLPVALWGFFFLSKPWGEWTSALTIGLASAREIGDRRGEGWTLHSLREAEFSMHRAGKAAGYVQQALGIFREIGDEWGVREALSNVGYAHRLQGRPVAALAALHVALDSWRETDDQWGLAWTLHSLGETHLDLGQWDDAGQVLREALRLFGAIGHRQAEGFALGNLGRVLLGTGRFTQAIEEFRRAMAIHDEVGDRWSASRTLKDIGTALHATGATAAAVDHWRDALAICEGLNDRATADEIRALLEP
ncbi:tetratricopeptide repeat protein [Actinosynnema sp. NPDC051121]